MQIPPAVGAEFPLINVMNGQASAAVTANPMAKINKRRRRDEQQSNPHQRTFAGIVPGKNRENNTEQSNETTKTHPSSGSIQTHFIPPYICLFCKKRPLRLQWSFFRCG